ncbi:MAG: hypothetical protein RL722_2322 [Pseudomonadota bacterium]|jgi:16S rRNA (uracil1498-N3)-methyltransferase
MGLRLHVDLAFALAAGQEVELPPGPARHVQVLRLQPGELLTVFDGRGGEWQAEILQMGRQAVRLRLQDFDPVDRELSRHITLAVCMPANDRFEWLVEKATELGVAAIQPLMSERSVLRLAGERAEKKVQHWRGVAAAAAEQSGRTRVPEIAPVAELRHWLAGVSPPPETGRYVLSLLPDQLLSQWLAGQPGQGPAPRCLLLSGPEGGLSPAEEAAAIARGHVPLNLGPRVLRADTAPLAALAVLAALPD